MADWLTLLEQLPGNWPRNTVIPLSDSVLFTSRLVLSLERGQVSSGHKMQRTNPVVKLLWSLWSMKIVKNVKVSKETFEDLGMRK